MEMGCGHHGSFLRRANSTLLSLRLEDLKRPNSHVFFLLLLPHLHLFALPSSTSPANAILLLSLPAQCQIIHLNSQRHILSRNNSFVRLLGAQSDVPPLNLTGPIMLRRQNSPVHRSRNLLCNDPRERAQTVNRCGPTLIKDMFLMTRSHSSSSGSPHCSRPLQESGVSERDSSLTLLLVPFN